MKSLLISFIAFFELLTCLPFGPTDTEYLIGPGRILWPQETWFNNPIELSQTNAGSSITLTINLRPSTKLESGIVQIIFPSSFSTEATVVTLPNAYSLLPGNDYSVTYSTTLPTSPGVYGPIGIITRKYSGGQIVDANFVFGFIATTSSALKGDLKVSRASSSTVTTINVENTLEFEFSLSFSFWDNDIIEIVPDSDWAYKSNISCKSVGDPNILFNKNGTNILSCALGLKSSSTTGAATGPNNYDVSKDNVYIYQITSPNYLPSGSVSNIKLSISNFTAPAFSKSTSTWSVNIWRWGTNNLLAQYTTSAGPGSTSGIATFTSWQSQSFISKTVMQGQTLFTKVTVATNNPLPAQSTLVMTFSGIDIYNTIWWSDLDGTSGKASGLCYVISPINGVNCVATDSTTAKITFTNSQSQGSISIVVLSYVSGASPQVTQITTYSSTSSNIVDQSVKNPGSFAVIPSSSSYYKIPDVALHALSASTTTYPQLISGSGYIPYTLNNSNDMNQGGVKGQDIFMRITPGGASSWGGAVGVAANLTFYFSLASTFEFDTFNYVYLDSGATVKDYINTATKLKSSTVGDRTLLPANPATAPKPSINLISVSFAASSSSPSVAPGSYIIFKYSGADKTSLPFIASNKATFYEIWGIVTYIVSSISTTEIGSSVISVLPQKTSSKLYTFLICNDKLDGIPFINYFEPINVDFDFSVQLYAIEIIIDKGYSTDKGFMGTGIIAKNSTVTLTMNSTVLSSVSTATVTCTVSGAKLSITLKNLGLASISTPSKIVTHFPSAIATLGQTSFVVNTTFYIPKSNDPSIKQILYQSSITAWTVQNTLKPFDSSSTGAAPTSSSKWNIGTSTGLTISNRLKTSTSSAAISNNYKIGIGLSTGFTFSSPPSYSANGAISPSSTTYYLPPQNDTGLGGFIYAYGSWGAATPTSAGIDYKLAVTNLRSPNYSISTGNSTWNAWVANQSPGSDCIYSQSYTGSTKSNVTILANSLTTPSCGSSNSNTVLGASADSVALNMYFSFQTSILMPAGGKIIFTMDSSWSWPSSGYCQSFYNATCDFSNNILTITLTADLSPSPYTINAYGVLPPSNNGGSTIEKDCFSALSTQTSSGSIVESWNSPKTSPLQMKITSSASVKFGTYTYFNITAYPNVPDILADLLLIFSFDKDLPYGSYITITAPSELSWAYPVSSNTITEYCWTNSTSDCLITSASTIVIYTSLTKGTKLVVYLDAAIKFLSKGTTGNFLLSARWGTVKIIDKAGISINVVDNNNADSTIFSITNDIETTGEQSTYSFRLTSSAATAVGDYFYIQFPRDFDIFLGDAEQICSKYSLNKWYISCSSATLSVTCFVDHWYLVMSVTSKSPWTGPVDVSVYGIRNPGPLKTNNFKFLHYDASQKLKSAIYKSFSITSTSPAPNIRLEAIMNQAPYLFTLDNYTIDLYPAINQTTTTFTSDNTFFIVFPPQFNLQLNNSIPCSAMKLDETSTNQSFTSWINTRDCNVEGNTVIFSIPDGSNLMVAATDRIRILLSNIKNPQFGFTRNTGWDTIGNSSDNIYWTNKFEIYISSSNNKIIIGRTYGILNSGYMNYEKLGFQLM